MATGVPAPPGCGHPNIGSADAVAAPPARMAIPTTIGRRERKRICPAARCNGGAGRNRRTVAKWLPEKGLAPPDLDIRRAHVHPVVVREIARRALRRLLQMG